MKQRSLTSAEQLLDANQRGMLQSYLINLYWNSVFAHAATQQKSLGKLPEDIFPSETCRIVGEKTSKLTQGYTKTARSIEELAQLYEKFAQEAIAMSPDSDRQLVGFWKDLTAWEPENAGPYVHFLRAAHCPTLASIAERALPKPPRPVSHVTPGKPNL